MKKILFFLIASMLIVTSLIAEPKAIVFDFGGVLTKKSNRKIAINFIQQSFHLSKKEIEKAKQEKYLPVNRGKTDEEFWLSYAKDKGIRLPSNWAKSFKTIMKDAIGINPKTYSLVEELQQQKMPVALLSNIDEHHAKSIRDFGFYEPFVPCLLSCEIGFEKPDLRAFKYLLTQLNLSAKEVVFIDDRSKNIRAAKKCGLDAILFKSEQQLRTELKKRGIFK